MFEIPNSQLRQALDAEIPEKLAHLTRFIEPCSADFLRKGLKLRDVRVPSLSANDIRRYAIAVVESEGLSAEDLYAHALDGFEHGAKRTYLMRVAPSSLKSWVAPATFRAVTTAAQAARFLNRSDGTVNYFRRESGRIRIVYSEMHDVVQALYKTRSFKETVVRRLIVVDADEESGVLTLSLDAPGHTTPHGSPRQYIEHYRSVVGGLFAQTPEPIVLTKALRAIEKTTLVAIPYGRNKTEGGRASLIADDTPDIRLLRGYKDYLENRDQNDEEEYLWLPQQVSPPPALSVPRDIIKTTIICPSSEIRFATAAVSSEVRYVIDQLLAHA